MKVGAFLAGLIGAVLGAVGWAVIVAATGYEVGYVAWGVGLLVGYGAKLAGGNGKTIGVACAVLALVSIFTGKMLAVHYVFVSEVRPVVEEKVTRALYDEAVADAAGFADLASEDEYPAFMVAHAFTEAESPDSVPAEDLADFKEVWIDILREFQTEPPSYEEWREKRIQEVIESTLAEAPITQIVIENLGVLDVVFAVLGLATAFKVACGVGRDETEPEAPVEGI